MSLQDDVNNFNANQGAGKFLELSAEISQNTGDRIISVPTVDDLPDLANNTVTVGTIVYVESLKILVISRDGSWSSLDEKEVRKDSPIEVMWSWGNNSDGRLGINDCCSEPKSSPVSVAGGFTDWCQVSAGKCHNLAIRSNGTLWAWGDGGQGALGITCCCDKSSPVPVLGGFSDWCQVSAGCFHSLAVRSNGTAWAWGSNCCGRLGDGTCNNKSSPVPLVGGFTDWCQVDAGYSDFSLGVRSNGTAWAWGSNSHGQLGNGLCGQYGHRSSPVPVVGGFTNWCQVSAGYKHSLGLRSNGTIWAWGCNYSGILGNGLSSCAGFTYNYETCETDFYCVDENRSSPVSVIGGFTDWCQISAGRCHSLAIRSNGTLWAWGRNSQGILGDGTESGYYDSNDRSSPVSVVGGFTDWCQVSAGCCHNVGVRSNGTAWAWGSNSLGTLGDYTTYCSSSPVSVVGGFTDWCQVSVGSDWTLGIRSV
jgi:alpha-tubulin suppressor-like RCC1 family protein